MARNRACFLSCQYPDYRFSAELGSRAVVSDRAGIFLSRSTHRTRAAFCVTDAQTLSRRTAFACRACVQADMFCCCTAARSSLHALRHVIHHRFIRSTITAWGLPVSEGPVKRLLAVLMPPGQRLISPDCGPVYRQPRLLQSCCCAVDLTTAHREAARDQSGFIHFSEVSSFHP